MELLFEIILDIFVVDIAESWTNFMKKKNPNCDTKRVKKVFIAIISIVLILVIIALFIGFFFLIELLLPDIFDICG